MLVCFVINLELLCKKIDNCQTYMKKNPQEIGKCFFKEGTTQRYLNRMIQQLRDTIEKQQWCLGDRNYKDYLARELFQSTIMINAKIIWLDLNKRSAIIADIVSPEYPQLLILYLGDNNIATIEPLILLKAPKLQKLYLNNNQITNIRSIRKCHFQQLKQLNLNGNYFIEQQHLQQAHFPSLEKLSLGYQNKQQNLNINNWALKTQFNPKIQIYSSKTKIFPYNKIIYFNKIKNPIKKITEPGNLFKTFQK